eukprot:COSAG04_NODE_2224_length_4498_cov_6.052285_2_plen_69_part_00
MLVSAAAPSRLLSKPQRSRCTDRPGVGECAYDRIKVMAYLTPTDADSGALRVIAGSHRPELGPRERVR